MYTFPALSTVTPVGSCNSAAVAPFPVSHVAGHAVAGDGVDRPAGDLPDDVVGAVADIEVVLAIHEYAGWGAQFGAGGRAAIAVVSALLRGHARENGDVVRARVYLPDNAV